jgi:large subunit ribosomal protein L10
MPIQKKVDIVVSLQDMFTECSIGIFTDYRGLTTAELAALRRKLGEAQIRYRVVKNSLAQIALRQAGKEELAETISGPVAVAFGYGEILEAAKVLTEYIKATKSTLAIKGGFFGDTVLSSKDVGALADLPVREVLIARVIGGIQSPITGLVNVLAGPIRNVMGVLQARITQLEGQ